MATTSEEIVRLKQRMAELMEESRQRDVEEKNSSRNKGLG